jgi:hypothetical protein
VTAQTSSSSVSAHIGINLDVVTGAPPNSSGMNLSITGIPAMPHTVRADFMVNPGYHYCAWMESGNGTTTATFFGVTPNYKSGMSGSVIV